MTLTSAASVTRVVMLGLVIAVASSVAWPAMASAAVVFDAAPAMDTNQTSATFQFRDTNGGTPSFSCKLDSGNFNPCTSPVDLSSLAEGQHTFSVEETTTGVSQPQPYTWTVDLTPPTTEVTGRPAALTNSTTATFTFTSPDSTATFRCSLNGAPAQQCTSPVVYSGLADATRSLLIQASGSGGERRPHGAADRLDRRQHAPGHRDRQSRERRR